MTDITRPDDDALGFIRGLQQGAESRVMEAQDPEQHSPDDAGRALELSKQTGADAGLIYQDVPAFEQKYKAQLSGEFLRNNPRLQDYVNSHTLAPVVSADDWAQLDTLDEKLAAFAKGGRSVVAAAAKGFGEHWDLTNDWNRRRQEELGKVPDNRFMMSLASVAADIKTLGIDVPSEIIMSSLGGVTSGFVEAQKQMGVPEATAEYNARQLAAMVEARLMRMEGLPHGVPGKEQYRQLLEQNRQKIIDEMGRVAPWIEAGKEPPPINDLLVEAQKLQSKQDAKAIQELLSESGKSTTRERAPELFRDNFVRPRTENATIGLDADAVLALYGGERPALDDGKLGWVPGIQEQFDRAAASGADVEIPVADFLSQEIAPELAKALKDHIRVRAGGLTPEEAKLTTKVKAQETEPVEGQEPVPPTILDSVRESAGLGPVDLSSILPEAEPGVIPLETLSGQTVKQKGKNGSATAIATSSFTLGEGLKLIQKDNLTGLSQALYEIFGDRLGKLVGDTPVHTFTSDEFAKLRSAHKISANTWAWFDPNTNQIIAKDNILNGMQGHSDAAYLLMHEGSHALTHWAIDQFPDIAKAFDKMREETKSTLQEIGDREGLADANYAFTNAHEFAAEGYGNERVQQILASIPVSDELATEVGLGKGKHSMWDALREIIRNLIKKLVGVTDIPNTMLDAFLKMQEHVEEAHERLKEAEELGLPFGTRLEGLGPLASEGIKKEGTIPEYLQRAFKTGSALKMNNERLKAYLEKVAKQHEEDIKFSKDQEALRAGKSATKDWRDNLPRVTEETRKDIWSRPDIALDRYLRDGEFPNGSRETPIRIARSTLPEEYRNRIPDEYLRDRGVHPDILAARFGLQSGREVLEHLARLKEQREVEGLTPTAHTNQLIDQEVQRRMNKDYGVSAEELLDAAKEHVFSPTTHDILHDELAALYEQVGQQPITQAAFKAFAKQLFNRIPIGLHSSDKYTAEMQRQRTAALDALLEGNAVESLKAQEKAAMLAYHADLSLKLEKQIKRFDTRVEKSWSRREPPGIEQQYAIWIHDILHKIGYQEKRIQGDWERQRELTSNHQNLREFVNHVSDTFGQDADAMFPGQFPVATFLLDDNFFKSRDELTPEEFTDVFNSLRAIDKFAHNQNTATVGGNKLALKEVLQGLVDRLKESVGGKTVSEKRLPAYLRATGSLLLNPETWMNRLDLGNALGPFNQLIIRPIMEGLYEERDQEKQFAKLWKALPEIGKREKIENPNLFMDPRTNFTTPMELDTHKLRAIIQNMGNEKQREKLAKGYGIDDPNKIWDWLFNTIQIDREHFKFAQQMGDIFEKAFEGTEQADVRRFGVAPQRIELGEIQTPWGMEKEWYHPLIPDPLRHSGSLKAEDMLDESGFYRPSPSSGFRQQRTGAVYPIDLSFDSVPFKLKQILKYNAMSNPVSEVSKIALDSRFRTAFKGYYGPEYEGAMVKWLKDVAGNRDWVPSGERLMGFALGQLQENLSSALIGFNLGTVLKHGPSALAMSMREVGPVNFLQSATRMLKELPGGQESWDQAFAKSEELRSRWRSVGETISGTNEELFRKFEKGHQYFKIRDAIKMAGHYPVAMSDLLSAVPMWDAAYRKALADGLSEGEAIYSANTQVRRTHGSTIIGARAGITRMGDPFSRLLMPFYNFFSNALQRNYEMMWRAKLAMQGRELSEMTGFEKESYDKGFKHLPYILGGVVVFGPLLGLIEQAVDPIEQKDEESDLKFWGKILTRQYSSMLPGVRDVINGLYTGHDPSVGMMGTLGRDVAEALKESTWSGEDPAKTFRKSNAVIGAFTGLTNEQFGKAGQFLYNWSIGKEDDIRGPVDVYQAYRHGTLERKPRDISELGQEILGVPRSQR